MYFAGIDIGSLSTEAVLVDEAGKVLASRIAETGANAVAAGEACFHGLLEQAGLGRADVGMAVATGYGRVSAPFADAKVTEITCHARGVKSMYPCARTVLDIGGQDSKAMRLDGSGAVVDFAMNDKCAAGTGRFLEVMARALGVDLDSMAEVSARSTQKVTVASICTVFAESEVISLVARATPIPDILAGIHDAVAARTMPLLQRVGTAPDVVMCGGVAKNRAVVDRFTERLGMRVLVPEEPRLTGAIGAALIARDRHPGP
ncbi:MAG: acyl-CoA dehydratase activase [Desulfatibacillaceae bacterium]